MRESIKALRGQGKVKTFWKKKTDQEDACEEEPISEPQKKDSSDKVLDVGSVCSDFMTAS